MRYLCKYERYEHGPLGPPMFISFVCRDFCRDFNKARSNDRTMLFPNGALFMHICDMCIPAIIRGPHAQIVGPNLCIRDSHYFPACRNTSTEHGKPALELRNEPLYSCAGIRVAEAPLPGLPGAVATAPSRRSEVPRRPR